MTHSSPLWTISRRNCTIPCWQMTEKIPLSSITCRAAGFDFDDIGWAFFQARQASDIDASSALYRIKVNDHCQIYDKECAYLTLIILLLWTWMLLSTSKLINIHLTDVVVAGEYTGIPFKVMMKSWEGCVPITSHDELNWKLWLLLNLEYNITIVKATPLWWL